MDSGCGGIYEGKEKGGKKKLYSHAGFVKFDIFLEPLHHFRLTGQNQGIHIATMSEPEVTNFF